jgi:hypothetical protein
MWYYSAHGPLGKLLDEAAMQYNVGYMIGICLELANEPWEDYEDLEVRFVTYKEYARDYPDLPKMDGDVAGWWCAQYHTVFVFYSGDATVNHIAWLYPDHPLRYFRRVIYHEMWHAICTSRGGGYETWVPYSNRCEELEADMFACLVREMDGMEGGVT